MDVLKHLQSLVLEKDTEVENSLCNDSEEKKTFQQLLEEAKKKEN